MKLIRYGPVTKTRVLLSLVLMALFALPACGGGGGVNSDLANTKVSIAISNQTNSIVNGLGGISNAVSVTVDVLNDSTYIAQGAALTISNGNWSGAISNVPMNTALTFVAHAYDNNKNQIFSGSSSYSITGSNNDGNPVTIPVSPVTVTTNFPLMGGITLPSSVSPSQRVSISFPVSGSSNETLTYNVTNNSGGTYTPSNGNIALDGLGSGVIKLTYTAPPITGTFTDSIMVTNSQKNSVTQNFSNNVRTTNSTVTIQFAPAVVSITGYRSGSSVYYSVIVSSQNNDPVTYNWSFNGTSGVAFSKATSNPATLTPYSQSVSGTISLTVTDKNTNRKSTISFPLSVGQFPDSPVNYKNTIYMGGSIQGIPLGLINAVSTFAGAAGLSGSSDNTGASARFYNPQGITTDGTSLYVADTGNNIIRKIVISTGVVTTIAGTAGYAGSADATGVAARFKQPRGITTDGTYLYVADTGNNTIRKIVISSGVVSTIAGSAGYAGSVDGTGSAARFNGPAGITMDGVNLYVADTNNHTVRKIVISTGAVTTIAGQAGIAGHADGIGAAATFNGLAGITTDGTMLYVADSGNNTIRKIVISTGAVTTIAGQVGIAGHVDGVGTAASFNGPSGITTDGTILYVSDTYNDTVRKIVISTGAVRTIAGQIGITGSSDGTGTAARFYHPFGVTTDGNYLYLADTGNDTIRKIQ